MIFQVKIFIPSGENKTSPLIAFQKTYSKKNPARLSTEWSIKIKIFCEKKRNNKNRSAGNNYLL